MNPAWLSCDVFHPEDRKVRTQPIVRMLTAWSKEKQSCWMATLWLACLFFSSISLIGQVPLKGQIVDTKTGTCLEAVQKGDETY
jgi:hypothetical protein